MILSPKDPTAYAVASAYQLRPMNSRRMSRLRVAWFVFGTVFGAAASVGMMKFIEQRPTLDAPQKASAAPAAEPVASVASAATLPELPPVATTTETPAALPVTAPAVPATAAASPAVSSAPAGAPAAPAVASPESPKAPEKPALDLPATFALKVQKHETLASILTAKGVTQDEANAVMDSLKKQFNPKRFTRGMPLTIKLDRNAKQQDAASVVSVALEESALNTVMVERARSGGFAVRQLKSPVFKGLAHAGGTIHSSLYQTAIDSGIPVKMVGEIIQAFSYDVDFQRDIHRGDKLDVVFENTHTDKNVTISTGKMLYASLVLDGDKYTVYRHTSADGFSGFYNAKGESVRKALLRTPINGAHITSGFGMRMHPLLGYSKMHKGVDFGAPIGTPIYAAGDGVIEEAGRKGGYGNYVKLRHTKTYATAYGHASRIAKGIHPGVHVRQGQIIAYVGSTGQSTGPHLHYEIIAGNAPVNPSGVKFRTGQTLAGREFAAFKKEVKQVETALTASPRKTQVASLR